jgi:hypothetical protein
MKICLVTAFPPSREALNEYDSIDFVVLKRAAMMGGIWPDVATFFYF